MKLVVNTYAWSPIVAAATPFIYLGRQWKEGDVSQAQSGSERAIDERNQKRASNVADMPQWDSPELAKLRDAVS